MLKKLIHEIEVKEGLTPFASRKIEGFLQEGINPDKYVDFRRTTADRSTGIWKH